MRSTVILHQPTPLELSCSGTTSDTNASSKLHGMLLTASGDAHVNLDYHIEVRDFLYSAPHALIRAEVDVRVTARAIEIFHRG